MSRARPTDGDRYRATGFFPRVLAALLLVNLTTIGVLVSIAYSFSASTTDKQARDNISQQVEILADKFDNEYRVVLERTIESLVNSALIDDWLQGSDAERFVITRRIERDFKQVAREIPSTESLAFVDFDGNVVVRITEGRRVAEPQSLGSVLENREGFTPETVASAELFRRLEQTPLLLFSGNMEWFMPKRDILLGGPIPVSSGGVAVVAGLAKLDFDTGRFGGAVIVEQRFGELFEDLARVRFFDASPIWVLDPHGTVLTRPDNPAALDPRARLDPGFQPATRLLSVPEGLIAYRDLAMRPGEPFLRLVVSLPGDLLLKDFNPAIDFFSVVAFVAVLITAAVSYSISRFLSRPVIQLQRTQRRLAHAQDLARLGYWELDPEGERVALSEQAAQMLGRDGPEESIALDEFLDHAHPGNRDSIASAIRDTRESRKPASVEHRIVGADGAEGFVRQEIDVERTGSDGSLRLAGAIQDVSERRDAENQIRSLAYYDQVTGLANRTLLNQYADEALRQAAQRGSKMAVVFLDLDHFKRVNDTIGHDGGDELLRQVAGRLRHCVRPADTVGTATDTEIGDRSVARLGGDEFIIVLNDLRQPGAAHAAAMRIRHSLLHEFNLGGKRVYVTGSLGIAIYPDNGLTMTELLRHADAAMYHAKARGRNRLEFFSRSIEDGIRERLAIETRLHGALARNEFTLFFQPRVDIGSSRILAFEALVRWDDPEVGLRDPSDFISIAEDTGLIVPIGEWVLGEAARLATAWQQPGSAPIGVSVNLSPAQFNAPGLTETLARVLAQSGLDPRCVELELTESVLLENVESSAAVARTLKAMGVHLSIDDFGTGYSSLELLRRFPLDTIKIDRSFIHDLLTDRDDALIVKTAINLGQNLGMRVVAEGIENPGQLELLRAMGCDEGQGYLFGKPVPFESIDLVLGEQRRKA